MFFPVTNPAIAAAPAIIPEWEQSVAEPALAIDLNTIKNFLNIPQEDDFYDAEKTAMTMVAQRVIEQYCQMVLLSSTWVGNLAQFFDQIRINKRPFVAVTKIEYVDAATGTITTVDPTTYVAGKISQLCGMVSRGADVQWPAAANRWDGVRLTVTAGWSQAALPYDVQQALLITIASIDRSRGDSGGGSGGGARQSIFAMKHPAAMGGSSIIPMEAKALLSPYRLLTVVA